MNEYFEAIKSWLEVNFDNCYELDWRTDSFRFCGFPESFNKVASSYHREVIEEWIDNNADEYVYTGPLEWDDYDIGTIFLTWSFIEDLMEELTKDE